MAIVARNGTFDSRFVRSFARACLACLIAWSRIGWEVRLVPRNVEHQVSAVRLLAANRCLSLPQCPPPRRPAHAPLWKSNLLSRGEQESISPTANILRPSQIKPTSASTSRSGMLPRRVTVGVLQVLGLGAVDVARQVEIEVVLRVGDLVGRHHAGVAQDVDLPREHIDNPVDVLIAQPVLRTILSEPPGCTSSKPFGQKGLGFKRVTGSSGFVQATLF